ncbi:RNA-binding protein [Ktedonobacter sp. SOSP1-52]|uniref:TROVE domain-containing protein n=1 Tax=Ktedonobacter sp. SOSP1-52 TaxID=2778366 RepID=UPI001916986D|nr:TROVE domain-containing protein [Ktedonobacter sp. SOSP1-52]GHO61506.1 RNA-binding protein [Ktedonobacter sp. SOSP1-52]
MKQYLNFGRRAPNTPQTEPIPGSGQTKNNASGFSWSVEDATRLQRFLILGSANGTFYVSQRQLTKENLGVIEKMLKEHKGRDVVTSIVEVSKAGRAASNDPALFALAACAAADDIDVRQYALSVLPQVARTGTHLLHFLAYVKQFRGWGRALRQAVASWYNNMPEQRLAYQLVKYQNRDGYTQRDALRLAHPKGETPTYNTLYHWVVKGWEGVGDEPHPDQALRIVWAFERAKRAQDEKEVAALIREYKLPREAVPTQHLNSERIWEALLEDMPMEAMLRNLATMTRVGLIKPLSDATNEITRRLRDQNAIRKPRLHPMKILAALTTYSSGKGVRGDNTWTPVQSIVDALNDAFYLSFANVESTGKRILIVVDTSGSMSYGNIGSMPGMSLHKAAGAMALITARTEPNHHIIGVDTRVHELPISTSQRLDDVVHILDKLGGGGTDLSLPMQYALQKKLQVDTFVVLTDSESWAGRNGHPAQWLMRYRQEINPEARIINVQMTSTHVTNNDPNDRLALEVVGFDANVPEIISSFIKGDF